MKNPKADSWGLQVSESFPPERPFPLAFLAPWRLNNFGLGLVSSVTTQCLGCGDSLGRAGGGARRRAYVPELLFQSLLAPRHRCDDLGAQDDLTDSVVPTVGKKKVPGCIRGDRSWKVKFLRES